MNTIMMQKEDGEGDYLINYTEYKEYTQLFYNQRKFTKSLNNPSQFVRIDKGTPLTTCLLIALEAFKNLTSDVKRNNLRLESFYSYAESICIPPLQYLKGNVVYSSAPTSGSATYIAEVVFYSNSKIDQTGISSDDYFLKSFSQGKGYYTSKNGDNQFRSIIGYLQLYIFFIALGSVLDIIAQTIYKLYGLDMKVLNWGDFVEFFKKNESLNGDSIYTEIINLTRTFDIDFAKPKIALYRNRFAHDGYCEINVKEDKNHKWILYLPRKSSSGGDCFDFDAIKECDILLIETIKYLNNCYEFFYKKVEEDVQPPWEFKQN